MFGSINFRQNMFLTAGHCLSDGNGNFYEAWISIAGRGFSFLNEEVFQTEGIFVFTEWHNGGDKGYDLGIVTLKTNNTGFGWYQFGWDNNMVASWDFDVSGYSEDRGTTLQRRNVFMDYSGDGVFTHNLATQTGDIMAGDAGGPVRYTTDDTIYGVTGGELYTDATHTTLKANSFTRITAGEMNAICDYINSNVDTTKTLVYPLVYIIIIIYFLLFLTNFVIL
eukprot:TRINITY_DN31416_c0_g1_i1.p1 TRINITY_DN31416_c0_g1~~TRINITY_DN31416_c0_g1_i1.p1  ORF type:complete len:223 (+),score=1.54 TRINITY_DN31416_c0_g1_i1:106-774(+)